MESERGKQLIILKLINTRVDKATRFSGGIKSADKATKSPKPEFLRSL